MPATIVFDEADEADGSAGYDVGDEQLFAVDDVMVAVADGGGLVRELKVAADALSV